MCMSDRESKLNDFMLSNNLLQFRWLKLCQLCLSNLILCVLLAVCSKQLLWAFLSLWWTQQQLLSVVGLFTPSIHILRACPFSCAGDGVCVCVCVLFNNSHLPVRSLESFILQSAGEFIERFGIQAIRKRNTNTDLSKRIFFFPAMALPGSGRLSQK